MTIKSEQWKACMSGMLKKKGNYPIIGAFDANDILLGFASYGMFRSRPAYKYTVEHSVYVRSDKRSMGIGKVLLHAIVKKQKNRIIM